MQTVVQKWGNSLGIRIPAVYAREFDLRNGSTVDIIESDGSLVIVPRKQTLGDLLSQVTEENIHSSVESGTSLGKEEW
ncbi:MAG TPA: AbrB/MazE/SpoVT family DNA-binding domain-containing protein [Treponemataceae bacterium]|jgi:antitoxin MazE|nr:AbrB/MazE/SpoVT family DNA-binding domain-containing protein [Treponema sp.]OQB03271.1 MAG: Antitoxin MazE [Spirochaetes bacterium ADurb.Bin215]HOF85271.1 AbrB/MazE/SpoVT family DNA-binding domain-containing protein [Treponemataceae bacterium]HOS34566.1 AbrB/MazE/SpoVT family DNA-binding domain-containing protein [Treponemataceae bacterium]HPA10194.1 AbrB/MazE/SpoVT family DNA-binding domain-containing protein [Treponemataceae bacterium]